MCTAKYSSKEISPMALPQSAVSELLEVFRAGEGVDLIRECVRVAMQELIEAEATAAIGAGRYERTESRTTERNGSRPRVLTTKAGDVHLAIPKLRTGLFFPEHPRAAPADRPGAVRGGDGGLRPRRLHPLASTTWSPRSAGPGSPSPRCPGSVPASTRPSGRSAPAPGPRRVPVRVPGRDLPARAHRGGHGGLQGRRGRHRRHRARPPGDPRPGRRRQRGRGVLAGVPDRAEEARPVRGAAW